MCHSCASRNPENPNWIPTFVAMRYKGGLDSRFRGNDPLTRPGLWPGRPLDGQGRGGGGRRDVCGTEVTPSPGFASLEPASPARGEAGYFVRLTCYIFRNILADWRTALCHSCVSRNLGCFVPAPVFLLGQREL